MNQRYCSHCSTKLDALASSCSSCGNPLRPAQLSPSAKEASLARVELVAEEAEWRFDPVTRSVRLTNEGWIFVPIAFGVVITGAIKTAGVGLPAVLGTEEPPDLSALVREVLDYDSSVGSTVLAISILLAVVGWFIAQRRARWVQIEEKLVDHHVSIAVEKNLVRPFPLLPLRKVVVIEHANGEQIAYQAESACYDALSVPSAGLAYVAHNQLLEFKTVSAS